MNYFQKLRNLLLKIEVSDSKRRIISLDKAILKIVSLITSQNKKGNKIIFIGNGGSASIASHLSTDFLKNAKIPAIAFYDPSLLTCISNDLGYEYVFEKPIEMLSKKGDILFSISSSGKSKNILRGVAIAKKKGLKIETLSGFDDDNPLRKLGDINFYVPSNSYGYVEITHLAICHCILDKIIKNKSDNFLGFIDQ